MIPVGSYEAKTKLSELLERVVQGETFEITRHGQPVAKLTPVVPSKREGFAQVLASLESVRQNARLGVDWNTARSEGRL